ncbi:MAG: hypothetical protein BIFFINMI_00626 [Phycisphaerae bacterium]|nr:hypothetical protein [Phycisphaerae bacterium]
MQISETTDSRQWSDGTATLRYRVTGTASDGNAYAMLIATAPLVYSGRPRELHPTIEPEPGTIDAATDQGVWNCTVRYPALTPLEIGTVTIEGDTTGGTQHVTQSLATVNKYAPEGKTAPNFKGGIGMTKDGPQGVDLVVPVFNFTVTKVWAPGSLPSLGTIFSLGGRVNNAEFSVEDTLTGLSITVNAGECLFQGARFGSRRGDGGVQFQYSFSALPNKTDLTVGDITVASKKGWEYLWVLYDETEDDAAKYVVQHPLAAYVERVYESGDFDDLGLSD